MDIATIGGLLVGVGAILISFLLEGGSLASIFKGPAVMIVIFGTLGAGMITTSMRNVLAIPAYLRIAFSGKHPDHLYTINKVVTLAERARREGVLGLEKHLNTVEAGFFRKALALLIDGTEATELRRMLETEIAYLEERHKRGIELFKKLGGFAPTMGIIGTVLGLIHTLANTTDTSKMAAGIASAFIATLWGICSANLFFLPVGDKLRHRHLDEVANLELVLEGVVSIQSGENPRMIRSKLQAFIDPERRTSEYP
ncbi:MAG: flagellar motor protein [bacterium]